MQKEPHLRGRWEHFSCERSKAKRFRELGDEEKQAGMQGQWQQESPAKEYLEQVKCCHDEDYVWWVSGRKKSTKWWCAIWGEKYDWKQPNMLLAVQTGDSVEQAKVFKAHAVPQGLIGMPSARRCTKALKEKIRKKCMTPTGY